MTLFPFVLALLAAVPVQTDIKTDGTMGAPPIRIMGVNGNYDISYKYGREVGSNLFHSFSTFNLGSGETATFTGPSSIQNIISRVTGGQRSSIDGKISSSIEGANLYLINPSGIMFGPKATLDVTGSFYASTAEYLELGHVRFDARATVPENFHLAIAPPSAFGLLDPNLAAIEVNGSQLTAPGIYIKAGSFIVNGAHIVSKPTGISGSGNLSVSAASVEISNTGSLQTSSGDLTVQAPRVTLKNKGSMTGRSGDLRITSGELSMDKSSYLLNWGGNIAVDTGILTVSDKSNIRAIPGTSTGNITIKATERVYISGSSIGSEGSGAGSITVDAADGTLTLDNSYIYAGNWSGSSESVTTVSARDITIKNGGGIYSISKTNKAGDIRVHAGERLTLSAGGRIRSNSEGSQDAGDITVLASNVVLENGGTIDTWVGDPEKPNPPELASGNGGSISIEAESVTISGKGSKMDVSTEGKGDAGTLTITSRLLRVADQGHISSESRIDNADAGKAGEIDLRIGKAMIVDSGYITTSARQADGGNITIDPVLVYLRHGEITTSVHSGEGNGGNIRMAADAVLMEGSTIAANADLGHGGNVDITGIFFLADRSSAVTATSKRGVPGTVDITAPLVDVSEKLVMLPERMLGDDDLAPRTCAVSGDSSSFIVGAPRLQSRPDRNLLAF